MVERQHRQAHGCERGRSQYEIGGNKWSRGKPGIGAAMGVGSAHGPVRGAREGCAGEAAHSVGFLIVVHGQHRGTGPGHRGLRLKAERPGLTGGCEGDVAERHFRACQCAASGAAHKLHARGQVVGEGVGGRGHLAVAGELDGRIKGIAAHQSGRFLQGYGRRHVKGGRLVGGAG